MIKVFFFMEKEIEFKLKKRGGNKRNFSVNYHYFCYRCYSNLEMGAKDWRLHLHFRISPHFLQISYSHETPFFATQYFFSSS